MTVTAPGGRWGATPAEWASFADTLDLQEDLLPIVCKPGGRISPHSRLRPENLGKVPTRYDRDGCVMGFARWSEQRTSEQERRRWEKFSDYGLCVITRRVRGIDVDVDDPELAAAVGALIHNCLLAEPHSLPRRCRAGSPRFLLPLICEGDFPKRVIQTRAGRIELLANGQQFVACGTHPGGERYAWRAGDSVRLPTQLPVLERGELDALWAELERQFGAPASGANSKQTSQGTDIREAHSGGEVEIPAPMGVDVDEARAVLEDLPGCEDYGTWIATGQALHHEFDGGPEGLALWDGWSVGASNYQGWDVLAKKWETFGQRTSGAIATLRSLTRRADDARVADLAAIGGLDVEEVRRLEVAAEFPLLTVLADGQEDAELLDADGSGFDAGWPKRTGHAAAQHSGAAPSNHRGKDGIVQLISGADIEPRPIDWIWPDYLALGKLHLIAGPPGSGKTTLSLSLAAIIMRGDKWPDGTSCITAGRVVIWSGEDDPRDTLLPRLIAMGVDPSQIMFVGEVTSPNEHRSFDPATDTPKLERACRDRGNVRMVIVDPIVSAVAGDSHNNADVRRSLQPLVDMAESLNIALVGITHFTKGTAGRDPLERVTGSLAFGAFARLVFGVAKVPDGNGGHRRVFVRVKSNIGRDGGGFEYDILQRPVAGYDMEASVVQWGTSIAGSPRELLADEDTKHGNDRGALDEAVEWVVDHLSQGPAATVDFKAAAKAAGIAERTLDRARKRLGVQSVPLGPVGEKKRWVCSLPVQEFTDED